MWTWIGTSFLVIAGVLVGGCVRCSGGTWYIHEAPLPEDWPELTPVGEVQVKQYPQYRAAVVEMDQPAAPGDDDAQERMFSTLFEHIKERDIAMTTPVEMGFTPAGGQGDEQGPRMASMAFLYRRPTQAEAGQAGEVTVKNLPAHTYASLGIRGGYPDEQFDDHVKKLLAWLAEQQQWQADGPPRYLGYNSPFVPSFMRYGEVQIPLKEAEK